MAKKINAQKISSHRSYSSVEAANLLDLHVQTIRNWIRRDGLFYLKHGKTVLIPGAELKAFISKRNASHKRPLGAGEFYCTTCHRSVKPAEQIWQLEIPHGGTKLIHGFCEVCEVLLTLFAGRKQIEQFKKLYGQSS